MKLLVLATNYPKPDGSVSLQYIHSRNKWYVKKGIDVSVISFKTKEDYILDGVKVYSPGTYSKDLQACKYDILVSHAPNLKNHYKFLKKNNKKFHCIVFFFHGHEVLRCSMIYPKPYDYVKKASSVSIIMRDLYDRVKLRIWKNYFEKIACKSQFVFVSNWMYEKFLEFVRIDREIIEDRKHIIYNCVGQEFEHLSYDKSAEKKYDFITIRNDLDGSKYGIDIVTGIARNNPQFKFCVIGKGDFYKYNKKPKNLIWIDKHLSHEEIIGYLNQSRCALMPTRADAQGVMMCEMATFGIPVITSDIDICREVFVGFNNVRYIDNDQEKININPLLEKLENTDNKQKNNKFFAENTIEKEIQLFKKLTGE